MNNKARIITKHDTTANWNAAVDFVPMKGEVIIYDDYQTEPGWENVYNEFDNPLESGAIASATGQDTSSLTRVRTNGYIEVEPSTEYTISADTYQVFILEYGTHNQYLNIYDGWKPMPYTFTTAASCKSIRLVFANSTNTVITKEEITWVRVVHQVDVPTPNIKVGDGVRPAPDLPFIYSEVDPTVPNWAKQATKPEYDASEISFESININPIIADTDDVQEAISAVGDYVYFMTPSQIGAVPTSRKVNGHALTSDVNVTAADVGAVPTSRTVNGHALTSDVNLAFSDLGGSIDARDVDYTPPSGSIYGQADNVDRALEAVDTYLEDLGAGAVGYEPSSPSTSVFGQATDVERALDNLDTYMAGHPIPTKTSDLTNDSGFITASDVPKELFVVMFFLTGTNPLTVSTTTTAYEVAQAVQSGKALYAVIIAGQLGFANLTPTTLMSDNGDVSVGFTYNEQGSNLMGVRYFEIHMLNDAQPIVTNIKTSPFLTEITSSNVTNALGYTPVNPSSLATVATTGDYDDLTDKPDLSVYMQKGVDYVTAGQKSGTTLGNKATAEGNINTASGINSHAEGNNTTASGNYSHAEGAGGVASGNNAHAECNYCTASGDSSHAEGQNSTATSVAAHAEGNHTTASGSYAHAEGERTTAGNGWASHAEGHYTTASGYYAHAEGDNTIARRRSQHTFGEFNVADQMGGIQSRGNYVEIVGNGADDTHRSNARTLDWSGNEVLAGTLTVGADPTNNMEVATKQYVDGAIPTVPTNVSAFTNDAGYLVSSDLVAITTAEIDALFV